ncbi:isochorismatase family protein [Nocardia sp. NBC_00416]|uniref:isochorismatase family protein n=1 Tax=Nocardia sp. NBC_00416 TaxID=2975991 RepID=UPI002E1E32A5
MPITALDPTTALVVIDLQQGIVGRPLAHPTDPIVDRAATLARAFRDRDLPVVLVNVAGAPPGRTDAGGPLDMSALPAEWTDLVAELDRDPGDILVTKYARSAFTGTGLAERLRAGGVTQVVVVGIATGVGVESTARDAHEQGFHVTLPVDAMTDSDAARHERSIAHVFASIAETGTTDDVLRHLSARS